MAKDPLSERVRATRRQFFSFSKSHHEDWRAEVICYPCDRIATKMAPGTAFGVASVRQDPTSAVPDARVSAAGVLWAD